MAKLLAVIAVPDPPSMTPQAWIPDRVQDDSQWATMIFHGETQYTPFTCQIGVKPTYPLPIVLFF